MGEYDYIEIEPIGSGHVPAAGEAGRSSDAATSKIKGAPIGVLWIGAGLLVVSLASALILRSSAFWLSVAFVLGLLAASSALVALVVNQKRLRASTYSYKGATGFRRLSAVVFTGANLLSVVYIVMVAYRVAVN